MLRRVLAATMRAEHGRILATLVRRCGNLDLAEEALQDAYVKAHEHWPSDGIPTNSGAWLMRVANNRLIDLLRQRTRLDELTVQQVLPWQHAQHQQVPSNLAPLDVENHEFLDDDLLRLIFTCAHPALAPASAIALTLRSVCGLRTEEIARAFLEPVAVSAQKIVRAKRKIADAKIPFAIPEKALWPERLAQVLASVYLVFNEGFALGEATSERREILCLQAIGLGQTLARLLPKDPECRGLLALMLLHYARRAARMDVDGVLIPLEEQNRALWDPAMIAQGAAVLNTAMQARTPGPYQLQAAIAALHAQAPHAEQTDWAQISQLYLALLRHSPNPVIELNAAVALAMSAGIAPGLAWIARIEAAGHLTDYYLLHGARADLLRRSGEFQAAAQAYRRAIELAEQPCERAYLTRRLREVEARLSKPSVHRQPASECPTAGVPPLAPTAHPESSLPT